MEPNGIAEFSKQMSRSATNTIAHPAVAHFTTISAIAVLAAASQRALGHVEGHNDGSTSTP
jgi:hypothetical protein